SERPHSLTCVLVPGACIAAGGAWQAALWPAAAAELVMAAADVLDDVADVDPGADASTSPAVLVTAAAGMLTLASVAALRVDEDGASPMTAVALGKLFGDKFAHAANGQAVNLAPNLCRWPLPARAAHRASWSMMSFLPGSRTSGRAFWLVVDWPRPRRSPRPSDCGLSRSLTRSRGWVATWAACAHCSPEPPLHSPIGLNQVSDRPEWLSSGRVAD